MFRPVNRSLLPMVLVSLFLVFGIQLAISSTEVKASDFERVFADKDDFKVEDFEDKFEDEDFEDKFKDEDFFEDRKFEDFEDEELLALALHLRRFGGDLERLFGNRGNLDRFFDPRIHRGFVDRDHLLNVLLLHQRLLDEADKRFLFADRDEFDFDFEKKDFEEKEFEEEDEDDDD